MKLMYHKEVESDDAVSPRVTVQACYMGPSFVLLTVPPGTTPSGNAGFKVKNTTGTFQSIIY